VETPLLFWHDGANDGETLSYGDTSISMENFCRFRHTLIQEAEALFDSLMYDWLPQFDLADVKDDMTNTTRGYSFVQHPANKLSLAYLKLSTRACTSHKTASCKAISGTTRLRVIL
jgi:hypothetical protein